MTATASSLKLRAWKSNWIELLRDVIPQTSIASILLLPKLDLGDGPAPLRGPNGVRAGQVGQAENSQNAVSAVMCCLLSNIQHGLLTLGGFGYDLNLLTVTLKRQIA